jgi:hypothetical protein
VADQMEAPAVMTRCRHDLDGVVDQPVEGVVRKIGRVGSRAG